MRRYELGLLAAVTAVFALAVASAASADRGSGADAFIFRARTSGVVTRLLMHVDRGSTARSIVVGLDRNGHGRPGARLSTGLLSAPRRGSWSTVSIAPTQLIAGRHYWLSVAGRGGALRARSSRLGRCAGTGVRLDSSGLEHRPSIAGVRVQGGCPIFAYLLPAAPSAGPTGAGPSPLSPVPPPAVASAISLVAPVPPGSGPSSKPLPELEPEPEPEPPSSGAPANTAPPSITGAAVTGETLKVSTGTWTGSPSSFTYQWQDCNSAGAACTNLSGASASSYKLKASDVGHTVRALVSATNEAGSSTAGSGATALVSAPSSGEALFLSPSGKDSSPCSQAQPCLSMGHAYEKASAGQSVQMLAGSYPSQTIPGAGKAGSAHVIFAPAPGASVTITATIYVFGSHVTIEGMSVKDVVTGNYDQSPGRPNPTDVSLLNLTGRNFEIDSATNVTVEGGSWGPASACGGPYGGNNNSIRQTIPAVAPENILINNTIIHDVQSYDLIECHIEGLAIFAGNHVTVSNSKFYGNSIYDVFIQANSGGKPNNVTLSGNWLAKAVDNSGANGKAVGAGNGVAIGDSGVNENVTLEENHLNDVLQMDDDGTRPTFKKVKVVANFGQMPFSGYNCAGLAGIEWSKNVWQNDKCATGDVNLSGAPLPYLKAGNDSSLDYTLTGAYANWPAGGGGSEGGGGGGGSEGGGSSATLFLSPSGSDSASCAQGTPCKTLAHAYSVAQGGETVKLAAGTYTDTSLPLTSGKSAAAPVIFEPNGSATVKFSKMLTVQAHGVELKGFTFERELYFGENAEGDVARGNALHNFEIIANGTKAPKNILDHRRHGRAGGGLKRQRKQPDRDKRSRNDGGAEQNHDRRRADPRIHQSRLCPRRLSADLGGQRTDDPGQHLQEVRSVRHLPAVAAQRQRGHAEERHDPKQLPGKDDRRLLLDLPAAAQRRQPRALRKPPDPQQLSNASDQRRFQSLPQGHSSKNNSAASSTRPQDKCKNR